MRASAQILGFRNEHVKESVSLALIDSFYQSCEERGAARQFSRNR
jgi:hypothetical protein